MHLALLIATLAALLSAPLSYAALRTRAPLAKALDGFMLVSVVGLVLIEVLPETYRAGGAWSAAFLVAGMLGPTLVEHLLTRARRTAHLAALLLALLGLVLHSLGDGAALSPAGASGHAHALGLAVALHSVPVGLVVWWLMFPVFGAGPPLAALLAMCAGTIAGYAYGISLSHLLGEQGWAWLQALVAGSILHVAFGRPHLHDGAAHAHDTHSH